jgi:hypothetical protein
MFSVTLGARRRLQAVLVGLGLLTTLATGALAHEGHDHGAAPPAAVTTSNPRVAAQSDAYELVGILREDRLGLYLDWFTTNEPVTDAKIAVTVGGDEEVQAEPAPDGTYTLTSGKFAGEGPLELIFAVTAPAGDDLLIGTLQLPAKPVAAALAPAGPSALQALQGVPSIRITGREVPTLYMIAGVALALGFLLGLAVRSRNKLVPAAGLALVVLVVSTAYAVAHEGHDHGEAPKAALPAGDAPRRLPDGTVFVPKPSQRLLSVRTTVTKPEEARKAVSLIGRVIADPHRSGLVQSINGGRIMAPEGACQASGKP